MHQVANSLSGGTTGQLIGNTAYLIQQGVETESMITRASPQAVSAVSITKQVSLKPVFIIGKF